MKKEFDNTENEALNKKDVSSNFSTMSKEEALKYCYKYKDDYIRDFDNISEGIRAFDCLISNLEENITLPNELPSYGMDY